MKRFAYLAVSAFVAASVLCVRPAFATPFNDVPANSWAADYIQTLAADGILAGYPNGKFLGNRPMTRNEVAVALARAIAKVEAEGGASKADLQKLARLMDAYKDELDGMGVRVTQIEDRLAALDKATKFAQGFTVHGTLWSGYSQREQIQNPTVLTGAPSCATTNPLPANACLARSDSVFNFTDQFIENDQSNDPYYGRVGPGILLPRAQWEFTPSYAVNQNLIISLPINIVDYYSGGYRQQQTGVGINPTLEVNVPNMNGVTGLNIRVGQLQNIKGSLTGLTYSPADNFHINYTDPFRPYPNGVDVTATIEKYLDVQAYGTRLDPVGVLSGAPTFPPNTGWIQSNTYLGPYYFQQTTNVYGSAPTTDTFTSGTGTLTSVTLSALAQPGTVFVSYYLGPPACFTGCFFTAANQPNEPSFNFVQTPNMVVFTSPSPIPAGVTVSITYQSYSVSNNTFPQRYDVGGRAVYRIPGIPSAQIGFSLNRLFDLNGGNSASGNTVYLQSASVPNTIVSDTVFGFDFVMPLAREWGSGQWGVVTPALYGEVATSKYTPDFQRIPAQSDTAGVIGLKFKFLGGDQTLSYQSVGPYYIDGASFMWAGQSPALFSFWNMPQLPTGFGIGNTLGINQQVDAVALANGYAGPLLANTGQFPGGTFDFPLFNQFKAQGPYFYSTFAPNTRGPSVQLNFPIRIGGVNLKIRLGGQQLQEIRPNSLSAAIFGPQYVTGVGGKYQTYGGGFTLGLPIWDRTATLNFDALYERIQRLDQTPFVYAADPLLGVPGAYNALGSTELTGTGQIVYFYPNYQNVRHLAGSGSLALPITAALTANVTYVNQAWGGEALNTLNQSISQTKTALNAGVLYNIPNTNSSINFFFTNYQWKDNQLPTYNWTQNRQNIYFTVKF
ncbi:MAG TPA: S-layer homology domain-containing protein [Candidatus Eremiobacteraceae bacterium]|nr:S-layer homology domain-containing protein [Candidatus Eremiobacteraceae bacterium]